MLGTLIQNKDAGNVLKLMKWQAFSGCATWKLRLVGLCMSAAHCKLRSHFIVFSICHGTNNETKWNLTSHMLKFRDVSCLCVESQNPSQLHVRLATPTSLLGNEPLLQEIVLQINSVWKTSWNIPRAQKMTALYCQLWGCNRPTSWRWRNQWNFCQLPSPLCSRYFMVFHSLFLGAPPLVAHVTNACLRCVLWIQTKQILQGLTSSLNS